MGACGGPVASVTSPTGDLPSGVELRPQRPWDAIDRRSRSTSDRSPRCQRRQDPVPQVRRCRVRGRDTQAGCGSPRPVPCSPRWHSWRRRAVTPAMGNRQRTRDTGLPRPGSWSSLPLSPARTHSPPPSTRRPTVDATRKPSRPSSPAVLTPTGSGLPCSASRRTKSTPTSTRSSRSSCRATRASPTTACVTDAPMRGNRCSRRAQRC